MKRIIFEVSDKLHKEVKVKLAERGISVKSLLIPYLEKWVKK